MAQLVHAVAPLKLKVDAGQVTQIAAPKEGEKKPEGHAVQADTAPLPTAPPVVVTPAGHAVQPAAETVPLPVTAPYKPGAHAVQAATDALPVAPPVVVTPAGHAVQAAAPDADE